MMTTMAWVDAMNKQGAGAGSSVRKMLLQGVLALSVIWVSAVIGAESRPNVIVFLFDDIGYSDIGAYGGEARTPHMDRLAANGLRFRSFYNTARCSPTRMALLTGAYSHRVSDDPALSIPFLRTDNNRTLAEVLRDEGYGTYMVGKWHLGFSEEQAPAARGFEHVLGHGIRAGQIGQASYYRPQNLTLVSEGDAVAERSYSTKPGEYYQKDAFGDYALDFLQFHRQREEDKPFFLYVPFNVPHFYIEAPKELILNAPEGEETYLEIYSRGWDQLREERFARMVEKEVIGENAGYTFSYVPYPRVDGPTRIPAWDSLSAERRLDSARRMALYAAMIEKGDALIGRVLSDLEDNGELDDTLILVLSDNGSDATGGIFGWARTGDMDVQIDNHPPLTGEDLEEMGQPGRRHFLSIGGAWAELANTPYRYFKRFSHEGGVRSPMIVHWPRGVASPDRWTARGGHVIDLMPTILDAAGIDYEPDVGMVDMDGISLMFSVRDEPLRQRSLGFEHEGTRALIDGDWKFVTKTFSDPHGEADSAELYHRKSDPVELVNLVDEYPHKVFEMTRKWNRWAFGVGVVDITFPLEIPPPDPDPDDLILDSFNRPDSGEIDSSTTGMSGAMVSFLNPGSIWRQSLGAERISIRNNRLRLAEGPGMSELAFDHNFVSPDLVAAGGFSVAMYVVEMLTGSVSDPQDRYVGFGVGLTQEEAYHGGNIFSTDSYRGSQGVAGRADFFVEIDIEGNLKVWCHGALAKTVQVGANSGHLHIDFALSGFLAGDDVLAEVYYNGRILDLAPEDRYRKGMKFVWRNHFSNYIGLSARLNQYGEIDNFVIRKGRHFRRSAFRFAGFPENSEESGFFLPVQGLGPVYAAFFPWVNHHQLGWLYIGGDDWMENTGVFAANDDDWWISRAGLYPWVYRHGHGWLLINGE